MTDGTMLVYRSYKRGLVEWTAGVEFDDIPQADYDEFTGSPTVWRVTPAFTADYNAAMRAAQAMSEQLASLPPMKMTRFYRLRVSDPGAA